MFERFFQLGVHLHNVRSWCWGEGDLVMKFARPRAARRTFDSAVFVARVNGLVLR